MKKLIFIISIMNTLPNLSIAAVIRVHKNTNIRLGEGINPVTEKSMNSCLTFNRNELISEDGTLGAPDLNNLPSSSLELQRDQITSYEQIDEYTGFDVSTSFNYMMYSGKFDFSYKNRFNLQSDSATVGIRGTANFGRWYLNNVTLRPEYAAMAKDDFSKFVDHCGTEYVAGFVLGQGIYIMFASNKHSVHTFEEIKSSMEASVDMGVGGGSLKSSFLDVTEKLLKLGSLKIYVRAYGAGGLPSLSKVIQNKTDVMEYLPVFEDIVNNVKSNQAMRTTYLTKPYPGVSHTEAFSILNDYKRRTLVNLYSNYHKQP